MLRRALTTPLFPYTTLFRSDVNQTRLILAQSALLALTLGLVVALLGKLVLPLALSWVGASSDVSALAHSYASIRLWGAPAVLLTYVLVGWFIGQQDSRRPVVILVTTNFLTIILDLLLFVGVG